ncbi:MAG: DUF3426 domain-containing protein [Pseudomonadota bacterium]|nr:DUF3426 domain-containing protein [Pseudomonadota bacterium]
MLVTRCPNCHARFRVSASQLELAEGRVRCGVCLKPFDAIEHEVSATRPEQDSPAPQPDTAIEPVAQPADSAPPLATDRDTLPASPEITTEPAAAAAHAIEATRASVADTVPLPLRAEPLRLANRTAERHPIATALLLLGIGLALALLLAQLLWFERARLARYPALQGVYALLCDRVSCDLAGNGALDQIRNRSVLVQPHPRLAGALKVAIVLENGAPFAQPWPALQLRFTDLQGREVAQRIFQPTQYLDTRHLSPARMPPGQPMQIELELTAPVRRGVSYELSLLPPAGRG